MNFFFLIFLYSIFFGYRDYNYEDISLIYMLCIINIIRSDIIILTIEFFFLIYTKIFVYRMLFMYNRYNNEMYTYFKLLH